MSKASSNRKCATVQNASTSSGANVFQYQYNGSGNDEWYLERADASDWQTQTYTVGTDWLPTVWIIDAGSGSYTHTFLKNSNVTVEYKYNDTLIRVASVKTWTSIEQTWPVADDGRVVALNDKVVANDVELTRNACDCNGHIVGAVNNVANAFACNKFTGTVTSLKGKSTINTYGYVNVPGPITGGARCLNNSYQCFYTITS